jgi:exodeoxyribonuclease VII large subunit
MVGVDPTFTLGQLAANRERILRLLAAEGLIERNAAVPLPLVPRRIGLVTSVGSAAYNDFIDEIGAADHAFEILACDARVQGAETERTVVAGIRTLARRGCDVIVVARGGGSRSDLAGFDSESIARAIATCPVPVLTGIGHEIDTSLADVVAHRAFKTPTACADFLVDRVALAMERFEEQWQAIADHALDSLSDRRQRLASVARSVATHARHAIRLRRKDLRQLRQALARETRAGLVRRSSRRIVAAERLGHLARARWRAHRARLDLTARRLRPDRIRLRFGRPARRLERARDRLRRTAPRRFRDEARRLESLRARARALDPQRVLERGYALVLDARRRAVDTVARVAPGDRVDVSLVDGRFEATIDHVEKQSAARNPEEKS